MQFLLLIYALIIWRTNYSISLGWSPKGFWLRFLLLLQCLGDPPAEGSEPLGSRTWFWEELNWCLCSPHRPFQSSFQWLSWTSPCCRSVPLYVQQIRHTISHWRFGWAGFRWAFWWQYLCLWGGTPCRWCFRGGNFFLGRRGSTGGLWANHSNHGQINIEVDVWFADDFLSSLAYTCRSEMMGMSLSMKLITTMIMLCKNGIK